MSVVLKGGYHSAAMSNASGLSWSIFNDDGRALFDLGRNERAKGTVGARSQRIGHGHIPGEVR